MFKTSFITKVKIINVFPRLIAAHAMLFGYTSKAVRLYMQNSYLELLTMKARDTLFFDTHNIVHLTHSIHPLITHSVLFVPKVALSELHTRTPQYQPHGVGY